MIRIAVCEDDYVYIEMIQSILQSCITVPYEVKFFSSGTEFLNTLTDHGCPYTLVITDIDLGSQSVNGITKRLKYSLETIRKFAGFLTKVSLGFVSSYD